MVECTGDAIRAWDKRLNEVSGPEVTGPPARVPAPMGGVPRSRACGPGRAVAGGQGHHHPRADHERRPFGDKGARARTASLRARRQLRMLMMLVKPLGSIAVKTLQVSIVLLAGLLTAEIAKAQSVSNPL